jgi:hypothetical protein
MARFGRSFVQAATQPAYLEGLFTAAQSLGSMPRRRREERQAASLQKGLFGLEQSALAGELTPEMYKEAVGSYTALMQQNPEQADEIRKSLARVGASVREQAKTQKSISAKKQINNLRNAALAVQRSGAVSTEEKQRTLAVMKEELKKIQEANPNVDLTQFDGMFEDVIVEARQLNKAAELDAREAANRRASQQIYAVKSLKDLDVLTERLLGVPGVDAEAVKKYSTIQQNSILDKQERDRQAAERGYDVTGDLSSVEKRLDGIPKEIADLVRTKISAAEKEQTQYRTGGTWTNVAARKRAANLVEEANELITRYIMNEVAIEQRQIASVESELADLMADGVADVNPNTVQKVADGLALKDEGKDFNDLSPSKQKSIYSEALKAEQERLEEKHRREVTSRQRQLAALRGEDVPKEETEKKTPEIRPVEGPEDYDGMVSNALARGNTPQSVRNSLERIGVPPKTIIGLVDKYKLPQTTDF